MGKEGLSWLFQLILDRKPFEVEGEWAELLALPCESQVAALMLLPEFVQENADLIVELFGQEAIAQSDAANGGER